MWQVLINLSVHDLFNTVLFIPVVIEEEVELFNIECFSGGESLIEWNTDALLYLQTVAIAYICYTDPKVSQ